jgi:hypothetical protein
MEARHTTIHVALLGEGTHVWRPVPARRIGADVFELLGHEIHDPNLEEWEFLPGMRVRCETVVRHGEELLVARQRVD